MSVLITGADGEADFKLTRLIEWAGYKRSDFILQASHAVPPSAKVVLAMHRVKEYPDLLNRRGYISSQEGHYVIPTTHPSFIQAGQSRWSAAFISDLQKAVKVSLPSGLPPQFVRYTLDPTPLDAYNWALKYVEELRNAPATYLSFDIETPYKGDDEEDADSEHDASWNIERIGFSYTPYEALSIPWAPEHMATIRMLLGSPGPKVVWNAGYDVPRIRRAGVEIESIIHDGMVAWHVLHSDLPKRLAFVATFTCPFQPAWKHLSGSKPAFYNATDADVELRSMLAIEAELRNCGMWEVYVRDVVELEPILHHMHTVGMPIDGSVRLDRATKLDALLQVVRKEMQEAVPLAARRIDHVYAKPPKSTEGLQSRHVSGRVPVCSLCGIEKPRKEHFKTYKRKLNPCAGGVVVASHQQIEEFYRLADFTPSRDQLSRYHAHHRRPLPTGWDSKTRKRRVSFGEKQLKELSGKYPTDRLYAAILRFREYDKLGGTYLGRPDAL